MGYLQKLVSSVPVGLRDTPFKTTVVVLLFLTIAVILIMSAGNYTFDDKNNDGKTKYNEVKFDMPTKPNPWKMLGGSVAAAYGLLVIVAYRQGKK